MNPQKTPAAHRKRLLLFFLIFLASITLLKGIYTPSVAQAEERELEDKIPKHLPIKVKIKKEKEKAFKDLKNEKWMRDLEIEVTNTGDKPIYFLDFLVVMPEITAPDGNSMGFPLRYGRIELGSVENKAEPDDIPIKPGETYIFKPYDNNVRGWDTFRRNHDKPHPKKLILYFRMLSFGDGTGFWRTDGHSVPEPPSEKSSLDRCEQEQNKSDPKPKVLIGRQTAAIGIWPATYSTNDLPAEILLAIFLSPEPSKTVSRKPNP